MAEALWASMHINKTMLTPCIFKIDSVFSVIVDFDILLKKCEEYIPVSH